MKDLFLDFTLAQLIDFMSGFRSNINDYYSHV